MSLKARARTKTGQRARLKLASLRQSPPNATPAKIPARTPLASMSVAHQWLAGEAATQLCQRFVVDRGKIADFERTMTALLNETLESPDDGRVELDAFVAVELIHRPLV